MKHLWKGISVLVCLMALVVSPCALADETDDLLSQISPKLVYSQFELNQRTGFTLISAKTSFTNESDIGIMEVQYTICVYDKNGQVLNQFCTVFNGLDTPIAPGESAEYETSWQSELSAAADHVDVTVTKVLTEVELPPIHLPKPGEPLYQALDSDALSALPEALPVEIELYIDRGGAATIATITDQQAILKAVELFMNVKVSDETQEYVTDNYNSMRMTFADGTEVSIRFNLWNLEICPYGNLKLYNLEELKPFVNYMLDFITPEE